MAGFLHEYLCSEEQDTPTVDPRMASRAMEKGLRTSIAVAGRESAQMWVKAPSHFIALDSIRKRNIRNKCARSPLLTLQSLVI